MKERIKKYLKKNNVYLCSSNKAYNEGYISKVYKGVYGVNENGPFILADKNQHPNTLINTLLHETGHFLLEDREEDYIPVGDMKINELKAEIFTCIIRGLKAFFDMYEIDIEKIPNDCENI